MLVHVWENDHGVCSTLGHVLYNVFHRDWGRETVSKRYRVPSRRNGHVLAKKKGKSITLADPSQQYPNLLGLSPPLLLSNTGTRNGVMCESHKMPRYRCTLDGIRSHLVSDGT